MEWDIDGASGPKGGTDPRYTDSGEGTFIWDIEKDWKAHKVGGEMGGDVGGSGVGMVRREGVGG